MGMVVYTIGYFFAALGLLCVILADAFKVRVLRFGIFSLAIGTVLALSSLWIMGVCR